MPGPLPKYPIQLTPEQERHVQQLSSCYTAPFAAVQRARILLLAHQHPTWRNEQIARRVGCCVNTVKHWRRRCFTSVDPCWTDSPRDSSMEEVCSCRVRLLHILHRGGNQHL